MQKTLKITKPLSAFSLWLLVFVLANPTIRLIDLFPDFIACFIIAKRLAFYADRAPFFAEAREGFFKLAIINLLRGPAFIIAAIVKSGNVADNDMMVLLTFVLSVAECAVLLPLTKNLFSALFYAGMRGADAAILPFPLSKRAKRFMRPEALKVLTYIFIIFRAAATALPEMLLLSTSDIIGTNTKLFNFRALYPYFTVILIPLILIFGIFLALRYSKYIRILTADGILKNTVASLLDSSALLELETKNTGKEKKNILNLLIVSVCLFADIRFSEFSMIDLIPNFIAIFVLLFAIWKIKKSEEFGKCAFVSTLVAAVLSAVSGFFEFAFLDEYTYSQINFNPTVQSKYLTVEILSLIEFLTFAAALIATAAILRKFLYKHTSISADEGALSRQTAKNKSVMTRKVCIFAFLAFLNGISKFLYVIFNSTTTTSFVTTNTGVETISAGLVPWFGTAVFISYIAVLGYALYTFNSFKEEIDIKYS